ncbi:MAG: hypothetical protein U5L76_02250 [Patescibacteria group bacterium]|nr:hypothetical protein [Patescibacteria group bacterium]
MKQKKKKTKKSQSPRGKEDKKKEEKEFKGENLLTKPSKKIAKFYFDKAQYIKKAAGLIEYEQSTFKRITQYMSSSGRQSMTDKFIGNIKKIIKKIKSEKE